MVIENSNFLELFGGYYRLWKFFQVGIFVTSVDLQRVIRLFWMFIMSKFQRAEVEVVYGFSFVLFNPDKPYVRFGDASLMGWSGR